MPKITVGSRFFKRSRLEYRDWILAVIRELSQNSQDENATYIKFKVQPIDDNNSILTCSDDGNGMDIDTLEKVFFALGESSKGGGDKTGGFGKARELICFSMDRYEIRTRNIHVNGSGDSYEISESNEYVNGCEFIIHIDASENAVCQAIHNYFSYSNPRCSVYLNDNCINSFANIGKFVRRISFADVYVNEKNNHNNACFVRVNGLFMYSRYINAPAAVYVEIDSHLSRAVLTANRDGIVGHILNTELDSFFNELSVDIRSSLMKKNNNKTQLIGSSKKSFKTISPKNNNNTYSFQSEDLASNDLILAKNNANTNNSNNTNNKIDILPSNLSFAEHYNVFILDETENNEYYKNMRSKIDRYNPMFWVKEKNLGGNRSKLMRMWYAICEFCLEIYAERKNDSVTFGVGWVFHENKQACHSLRNVDSNNVHFLCLNPVNMDGEVVYSISDKQDWHKLAFLALHEVCHVNNRYHDEDFASDFTEMSYILSYRMNELFNRIKSII